MAPWTGGSQSLCTGITRSSHQAKSESFLTSYQSLSWPTFPAFYAAQKPLALLTAARHLSAQSSSTYSTFEDTVPYQPSIYVKILQAVSSLQHTSWLSSFTPHESMMGSGTAAVSRPRPLLHIFQLLLHYWPITRRPTVKCYWPGDPCSANTNTPQQYKWNVSQDILNLNIIVLMLGIRNFVVTHFETDVPTLRDGFQQIGMSHCQFNQALCFTKWGWLTGLCRA